MKLRRELYYDRGKVELFGLDWNGKLKNVHEFMDENSNKIILWCTWKMRILRSTTTVNEVNIN